VAPIGLVVDERYDGHADRANKLHALYQLPTFLLSIGIQTGFDAYVKRPVGKFLLRDSSSDGTVSDPCRIPVDPHLCLAQTMEAAVTPKEYRDRIRGLLERQRVELKDLEYAMIKNEMAAKGVAEPVSDEHRNACVMAHLPHILAMANVVKEYLEDA